MHLIQLGKNLEMNPYERLNLDPVSMAVVP